MRKVLGEEVLNGLKCGCWVLLSSSSGRCWVGARAAFSQELWSSSEASASARVRGRLWKMMFVWPSAVLGGDIPISGPGLEELQGRQGSGPVGPAGRGFRKLSVSR